MGLEQKKKAPGASSAVAYRVVSIGALAANELWGEPAPVRPGHATTVVIESGDQVILVDPSLPGEILDARLRERCGYGPERITDVFVTDFRPELRRGLPLFPEARWLVAEREREEVGGRLVAEFQRAEEAEDPDLAAALREEIALLKRFRAAPDQVAPHVDLFPLPGRTPGSCGLLIAQPQSTTLITGDLIPTIEHLEAGRLLPDCYDLETAQESFREAIEIADVLILGRDNLTMNPMRRPF
ncbi:MAG: MBL fold metallo-hydrolase [Phycisphaerales bacterium]